MKPGNFEVVKEGFNIAETSLRACSGFFLFLRLNHRNTSKIKNIFYINIYTAKDNRHS